MLSQYLQNGEVLEIRGDGKAGGGLLMIMETFAQAMARDSSMHVQYWPLFGSARKGANVRAYMRLAKQPIHMAASIARPHLSILVDEATAEDVDFASGMKTGIYIINTPKSAKEAATLYKLPGLTITVDGNKFGEKYLGKRMGNISLFAALMHLSDFLSESEGREALDGVMKKRRLPDSIRQANLDCYDESVSSLDKIEMPENPEWKHEIQSFEGYQNFPIGAQSQLRTSLQNRTSLYRPAGLTLNFSDPTKKCSGCSLCLTNCPENIIQFVPHEKRGLQVTGANISDFCKLCRECVEVCPVNLFSVVEEAVA